MATILGYGSLMDKSQFEAWKNPVPVTVHNVKRSFAKDASRGAWMNHSSYVSPIYTGVLSAELKSGYDTSAVAYDMEDAEVEKLMNDREFDYELVEVDFTPLSDESKIQKGLIMIPNVPDKMKDNTLPIYKYMDVCLSGAASWGEDFLNLFLDTTYLANGKITLRDYLAVDSTYHTSSY
ncbi:MAG: hypothetical protein GOU98_00595 [Candidatus Altiarchaeota archaeon]|nr:hypothetical protein [Candidatus Altiarchaeota archaeon]